MGGAAVAFVIAFDFVYRVENVVHGQESEEAFAAWKNFAETGFLRDHGAAGAEITGGAVAEPAGSRPDVLVAGDGEFATGLLDVLTIAIRVARHFDGTHLAPAVPRKQGLHLIVDAGSQFKLQRWSARGE